MIAAVTGRVAEVRGDKVTIATSGGVSYELALPIGALERLPSIGDTATLLTMLIVRDDGWALFGFDDPQERAMFQRLMGATGVGPRLALAMVSTLGGARVARAIKEADIAALCTVPGVGKKTAERIIVELKDRIGDIMPDAGGGAAAGPAAQAVQALVNLGYLAADADRAVRQTVQDADGGAPVDLIRGALQLLRKS